MCSPRKSNENFSIFTFYESKQMSLTQDSRWSLGRSIALQLQRQTDLLLCTINCFLQWDHLPNMAVGDLAFYYTLYLWEGMTSLLDCLMQLSVGILKSPSSSLHLCSPFFRIVGSRFTISLPLFQNNLVKIHHRENKVGWRSITWLFFPGQDSVSNKQKNKTIKHAFV